MDLALGNLQQANQGVVWVLAYRVKVCKAKVKGLAWVKA
jgi:hypothetical protein